jgi:uncharacterized protein
LKCNKLRVYLSRMHFAQEDIGGELIIRAYGEGVVTIGEKRYRRSIILTRERLIADWRPQRPEQLSAADFDVVRAQHPDILLLGTGSGIHFPPPALTAALLQAGIGVEVMDTAAACRTYNILFAEQRNVAAALLLG